MMMRKVSFWIGLFGVLGWISGAGAVPVQWTVLTGGNGHSYELVVPGSNVTWTEAQADAKSRGGYLATLTSQSENEWVSQTFNLDDYSSFWHTGGGTGPALGALWDIGSQSWEWVSGEVWSYENWRAGQEFPVPSNANWGMSYSTLEGVPAPSALWQHFPVDDPVGHVSYVVEYPIPEPSTALMLALGITGLAARQRHHRRTPTRRN